MNGNLGKKNGWLRSTFCACLIFLLLFILPGCNTGNSVDSQARQLMSKYNLHPVGEGTEAGQDKVYTGMFGYTYTASKSIGLNLEDDRDKPLHAVQYLLEEETKTDKIYAVFIYNNQGDVAGAVLYSEGFLTGITSLKDRSSFNEPVTND